MGATREFISFPMRVGRNGFLRGHVIPVSRPRVWYVPCGFACTFQNDQLIRGHAAVLSEVCFTEAILGSFRAIIAILFGGTLAQRTTLICSSSIIR